MLLHDYVPALKYGAFILPSEIIGMGFPLGANAVARYVDGTNGSDSAVGTSPQTAMATVAAAVAASASGDVIYVFPKAIPAGATDPVSYTETVVIPSGKTLALIGVRTNRTQGGIPQLKVSTAAQPIIKVMSAGCLIANLGINGAGGTNSGIMFYDDGGTTASSFGGVVTGCHFKNCRGTSATDSTTGGALWLNGAPWQMRISGNEFYKNVGGIVVSPTSSAPQDIVIEDNVFAGTVATADSYIYITGSNDGIVVKGNFFASALPNLSSGAVKRYISMTGSTGIFADNYVSGSYTTSGFGAASAAGVIPTTVGIAHNYSDAGLIVRE